MTDTTRPHFTIICIGCGEIHPAQRTAVAVDLQMYDNIPVLQPPAQATFFAAVCPRDGLTDFYPTAWTQEEGI